MSTLLAHKGLVITLTIVVGLVLSVGGVLRAKKVSPLSFGWYGAVNQWDGLALGGWDPVSLREGTPARGRADLSLEHAGATWTFATAAHRDAFVANPQALMPAYGGFCAFASSKGFTARADPSVSALRDDRLYVFADAAMRKNWEADPVAAVAAADAAWAKR
jgi:hypothetical protein